MTALKPGALGLMAALTRLGRRGEPTPCASATPAEARLAWTSDDPEAREIARRLCTGCPVINQCREAGQGERFGVWGGRDRTPRDQRGAQDDTDHTGAERADDASGLICSQGVSE